MNVTQDQIVAVLRGEKANLRGANIGGANLGDWERGPDGYARKKDAE